MENKLGKTRSVIILSVIIVVIVTAVVFVLTRDFDTAPMLPAAKSIPGLVLYYPFAGNAEDMSGNNINGEVHGATLCADRFGKPDSAYYFDGIDDSITFDASQLPMGSSPRTISAWINADSFPLPAPQLPSIGSRATIIGWGHDDVLQLSNMEIVNSKLTYHAYNYDAMMWGMDIELNKWYHLVIVYSGQKTILYINGDAEEYDANVLETADFPGRIGAFPDQSMKGQLFPNGYDMSYFHGIIDEVRVYDQALTSEQVLMLYNENR